MVPCGSGINIPPTPPPLKVTPDTEPSLLPLPTQMLCQLLLDFPGTFPSPWLTLLTPEPSPGGRGAASDPSLHSHVWGHSQREGDSCLRARAPSLQGSRRLDLRRPVGCPCSDISGAGRGQASVADRREATDQLCSAPHTPPPHSLLVFLNAPYLHIGAGDFLSVYLSHAWV